MIRTRLFLCAESAVVDSIRNTLSAFHIMEQALAPSFPVVIPRVTVITSLTREPSDPDKLECTLTVRIGERQIYTGPLKLAFLQQMGARAIFEMQGMVVSAPGDLIFRLLDGEKELANWSVSVVGVNPPAVQMFLVPPAPNS